MKIETDTRPRQRRRWLSAVPILALVLFATACGGGDDESSSSSVASVADVQTEESAANAVDDNAAEQSDSAGDEVGETVSDEDLTDEQRALDFVACMRENGVDLDDPTVAADGSIQLFGGGGAAGGAPARDATFEEAFTSCGDALEGATFFQRGSDDTERNDELLDFAQCLRDQGIDVDDPDLSAGPGAGGARGLFGDNFDPQDSANAQVLDLCRDESGFAAGGRP